MGFPGAGGTTSRRRVAGRRVLSPVLEQREGALYWTTEADVHKIEISPDILNRIKGYRGSLHIFDNLDPARTAHVIVDLQNGFMEEGATVELPVARDIVPNVNEICKAVRSARGHQYFHPLSDRRGDTSQLVQLVY